MRTQVASLAAAALTVCLVSAPVSAAPKDRDVELLASLTAENATLTQVKGRNYRLTLRGTDSRTIWFTDRPVRDAGTWPTRLFVTGWDEGASFALDPPNVAVVLHEPQGTTDTVVAVMRRAKLQKHRLTARLRVLTAEQAKQVKGRHADRHDPISGSLKAGGVTLFIDYLVTNPSTLWEDSIEQPGAVFRIYFKDGEIWRCVPAATANFQAVFNLAKIKWFAIWSRYEYTDPWSWCAREDPVPE